MTHPEANKSFVFAIKPFCSESKPIIINNKGVAHCNNYVYGIKKRNNERKRQKAGHGGMGW